jgi:hypothetical protein
MRRRIVIEHSPNKVISIVIRRSGTPDGSLSLSFVICQRRSKQFLDMNLTRSMGGTNDDVVPLSEVPLDERKYYGLLSRYYGVLAGA